MMRTLKFVMLLPFRLLLPISFALALLLEPVTVLRSILHWARSWRQMWDEPI